ncbi:putative 30S ribosomal protein S17-like protein [Fusarium oxysporum f. sp. cubense]|uniref:Putative 30S ribosomal protein S17-like protein n=1 Tax=Fusarium oxysporum f. sp. cubense TaxID=61366 RepID=A0A559KVS2_FUSOC|nr:putative 30S ribosomal protein S17-like protein [Fusarium oxysporum f. sp. cubense]
MASTEINSTNSSTIEAPDIEAVGIFDKLSQPCDGVGKPVWIGTPLSNAAYNLILLLGASRTPEVPALVFFRPLVQRQRWTESGEIHTAGCKLSPFARLCLQISELPTPRSKEPEDGPSCPKDIFAWFCCSSYDINSDQDSTYLGDELNKLLSAGAFVVHVKDGLVYLSLSEHLRDTLFQVPTKALQEARLGLVGLVILSLAEPYAEPLWEMVSLHCRNILKSTVIPYLFQAETRELRQLSQMIESAQNSRFNSALMMLPFHLVKLGFVIDLINWQALFDHFSPSYNIVPKAMGVIFYESDAVSKLDEILARTPWLQTSSFLWSLIGFAVAQKRRQSTDMNFPGWYEKISNKWLVLGRSGSSTMERVSRSLVFPETVQSEALPNQAQLLTQASLGIALNALGFPEHGCTLLDRFLTTMASDASSALRPTESVLYGLLSAELLNYRNSSHKGEALQSWGLGLVSSRNNAQLGNRLDSISIKLAVADTHISLADYATAENLLKQVSSSGNLDAYTQIVTTLRLNKIGRRTGRFSGRFGDSLGMVVPLTAKADTEVQKEFVAELAATVTHLKRVDPTSPYHSDLGDVVQQTIDLYDQHTLLQDDWRLQMIRKASVKTSQESSNLTPLHKAAIGQQAAYSAMSPPSIVSPDASFISSSAASIVVTNDHDTHAETWHDQHGIKPFDETALVSQEALTVVNNFLDQLLFYFLSSAQAMTLSALRPAVAEVLKPKLAKDAVNYADEELREYFGEDDEEDCFQRQGTNQSQEWDLELVWKRVRLRCMFYSSLGDMEEKDENLYVEKLGISPDELISAVISPDVAIFLTSVLEYVGELILIVAGQAAYHRLDAKFQTEIKEGSKSSTEIADRIIVEVQDMERVALDQSLGRPWRGLRKRIQSPAYDKTGRTSSRSSSDHSIHNSTITGLGRSITYSKDEHKVESENTTVKEVEPLRQVSPGSSSVRVPRNVALYRESDELSDQGVEVVGASIPGCPDGQEASSPANIHTSPGKMSDIGKVEEVIRDARRVLDQMPHDHHDRAAYLDELGVALGDKFSITRDMVDLEEAIRLSGEAVDMTPMDSPDRAGRLSNCGIRLAERYSVTEEMSDLKDAIGIMREVLEVTPSDDPDRAMYMNNLATALADQYAQTSKMADLNESIYITQQAIDAAVEDYSDRPMYLNSLALRLGDRYVRTGEGADLDNALSIIRDAINSAPDDSPDRGLYLNTLVIQLGRQYARTGAMADLQESVRVAHDIVDTSLNDPDRPMYLNNLGLALGELYSVAYEDSDIDNAIMALREALGLSPEESTSRAIYMHNLGIQFGRKYSKTGATTDLQECLRLIRKAIKSVTADHPDRAGWLSNLGVRLGEGYLRGDTSADIEEAIRVTQEAIESTKVTTDKAVYLCNLGNRLGERYSRTGVTADIDNAIEATKEAINISPADPVMKAMCFLSLGSHFGDRYDVEGTKAYLDESIRTLQRAVDMMPENHSGKALLLNSLGVQLAARYTSVSAIDDLESAIEMTRRAIEMTPKISLTRALFLHNLGAALGNKYTRMNTPADLDEAIRVSREAVGMTPSDHPNRATYLKGLAIRLGTRYSRESAGSMSDLSDIIGAASEAVDARPSAHTKRPVYLNSLGIWLMERYKRVKRTTDLVGAIRAFQEAVNTSPESHPGRARYLVNLGTGLDFRYSITGASADREGALSQFQSALREPNYPPIDRITAGIAILQICATTSDWEQVCDALEVAVSLVPRLTVQSLENPGNQHLLGQAVGLASNAAAAALNAGRGPTAALKFLEQGRGVLTTALEEIRTDVIELKARYPELAKRFAELRVELDPPVARDSFHQDDHAGFTQQARATRRYDAGNKLDEVIAEIQRQPGFEDFLAAPSEEELRAAATCGPVVVINTSEYRCDAILVEHHQIRSVPLPKDMDKTARNHDPGKIETLEWLWDTVAHPILDALGFNHRHDPLLKEWPRIWWVATGIMTKFPLHAAGRHNDPSTESASVLDRVMSSYSSSIKTVIKSRRRGHGEDASSARALLVAMKHTPEQSSLPFAAREIEMIGDMVKRMNLEPIEPGQHKHDTMAHLPQCKVFHFAGHGHTDGHDPMRSLLLLEDGKENPLTVANLLEVNLRKHLPFLAYLCACGTGRIRDKRFIDESIHLISACQLAGFRHVIGTLWEVNHELCVDMERITYEGMRDGSVTDESVCRGLHNATRQLRDRWLNKTLSSVAKVESALVEDETCGGGATAGDGRPRDVIPCDDEARPLYWVPYVHFGV